LSQWFRDVWWINSAALLSFMFLVISHLLWALGFTNRLDGRLKVAIEADDLGGSRRDDHDGGPEVVAGSREVAAIEEESSAGKELSEENCVDRFVNLHGSPVLDQFIWLKNVNGSWSHVVPPPKSKGHPVWVVLVNGLWLACLAYCGTNSLWSACCLSISSNCNH
jgi:hypothetical protein